MCKRLGVSRNAAKWLVRKLLELLDRENAFDVFVSDAFLSGFGCSVEGDLGGDSALECI